MVCASSCTLASGRQVTSAVIRLATGSASRSAPYVQTAGHVALGDDALDVPAVGGHHQRTDALLGQDTERGAHALRSGDGRDLAALVAQQLADLHRNPLAERSGACTRDAAQGNVGTFRPTVKGCRTGGRPSSGSGTPRWRAPPRAFLPVGARR